MNIKIYTLCNNNNNNNNDDDDDDDNNNNKQLYKDLPSTNKDQEESESS